MYQGLRFKEPGVRNQEAEACVKVGVISVTVVNTVMETKEGAGWREGVGIGRHSLNETQKPLCQWGATLRAQHGCVSVPTGTSQIQNMNGQTGSDGNERAGYCGELESSVEETAIAYLSLGDDKNIEVL